MNLNIDEIVSGCLSDLVCTKGNSFSLYKYQLSQLPELGKEHYITFLKDELSEIKIDKLLEDAYAHEFQNVILINEPTVKIKTLNEVEIYEANNKFINNKRNELLKILSSLCESDKKEFNNTALIQENQINTFVWKSSEEALNLLYSELIDHNFIPNVDFEIFKVGFSGTNTEHSLNIPWIKITKKKQTSKVSLIYLLNKLHSKFISFPYESGYTSVTNVFCDKELQPFKGMKQALQNFRDNGFNDKISKEIIDDIIYKLEELPEFSKVR